ncbi:TPA: phage tail tape measure protein [Pseudomonas aeruginosa]|uniref:phage tail tape measure protein n=2 Tax=Pseudomonas aeruginosa TaxID=287 RepID=UPI0003B9D8BA|nr:phage tail tape measure protein [Pseudomonas aeruginosa]ANP62388.1 phage tail tape measure protein [Pseudomonas aeruginosa]ERU94490.1 lambda family phage tail tape measure protein [Pseudomonas aeruginosa M9A.1]HEH8489561.1 phage tail tape measure protein [Pseudomonas aeruginosa]HEH8495731.1 phage tail tape measure protein [Pseudomonas aeruginosa]HEH8693822.1 phage tail tape measure protein [Pseudomonas aeruginosa]
MSNFAELGIKVDSSPAVKAAEDLDKLVDSADQAEQAIDNLSDASKGLEQATKGVSRAEENAARSVDKAAGARERQTAASRKVYDSAAGEISIISQLERALSGNVANIDDLIRAESLLERARKAGLTTLQDEAQYQDRLGAAYDRLQKAETKESAEKQRLVAAQNRQIEAMQRTVNSIDPVTAALARLEKQEAALRGLRAAGGLDDAGLAAGLEKIAAKRRDIEGTGGAINKLGLTSKEARENVLQLGNALSTGNWRVAAHNIAEIGVNAGGAASGVVGVLAPIGLLAAAIGGLSVAYLTGQRQADDFNKAIISTGNASGLTAQQLTDMLGRLGKSGNFSEASEALLALVRSGRQVGSAFEDVARAATEMSAVTGRSAGDIATELAGAKGKVADLAAEYNRQYHFMNVDTFAQIEALERQGRSMDALKLLAGTLASEMSARNREIEASTRGIVKAWDDATKAVKRYWQELKSRTAADPETFKLQVLQGQLEDSRKLPDSTLNRKNIEFLEKEIALLQKRISVREEGRRAQAEGQEDQDSFIQASKDLNAQLDNVSPAKKRAAAIRELNAQFLELLKSSERLGKRSPLLEGVQYDGRSFSGGAYDQLRKGIEERLKDQKGSAGSVDLRAANTAKNSLAEITATYRNAQKELEASQRAGVISAESYAQQRISIIRQERDEVTHAYEREIAALETARAKQGTSAAQRIQLDQKIADSRTALVKAQQDADSQLNQIELSEQGRLRRQEQSVQRYTQALQAQVDALRLEGERAAAGVSMGGRERSRFEQLNSLDDRYNQQLMDLENQRSDPSRQMSDEEYEKRLAALRKAHQDLRDTVVSNYDQMTAAQSDWSNGASGAWNDYLESARNVAGQTHDLFTNAFRAMEDAVATFATTGKLSFSDFAKSILADMARIATRAAASQALSSLFGGFFGGGNAAAQSGVDNLVSNSGLFANGGAFAGGVQMFATGGAFTNSVVSTPTAFGMSGGRMGVMGEAGPEAVMPLTRTSSGALGVRAMGGSSSQINVEVNIASDGSANVSSSQPGLDQFGRDIGTFVEQKYRQLLARDLRRDGAIGRAING